MLPTSSFLEPCLQVGFWGALQDATADQLFHEGLPTSSYLQPKDGICRPQTQTAHQDKACKKQTTALGSEQQPTVRSGAALMGSGLPSPDLGDLGDFGGVFFPGFAAPLGLFFLAVPFRPLPPSPLAAALARAAFSASIFS